MFYLNIDYVCLEYNFIVVWAKNVFVKILQEKILKVYVTNYVTMVFLHDVKFTKIFNDFIFTDLYFLIFVWNGMSRESGLYRDPSESW